MKKRVRLRTKMVILSFILVLSSVTVSGINMIINISSAFEEEIGERGIAIARTIAQVEEIQKYIVEDGGEEYIQPIAERIRLSTNVDYVVILDMEGIRYSHPSESKVGLKFAGGDERQAFSELEYTSKVEGDLGYAIRAFVPIMDYEGVEQIGVAVVGNLVPNYQTLLGYYKSDLLLSLTWGLLIGLLGSWLLANNVKKQTYQLEPYEISRIVEERSTIMETLDIGILTTDENRYVDFMNSLAQKYTGENEYNDLSIKEVFKHQWISGKNYSQGEIINRPLLINKTMYLISMYPIYVQKEYTGDLITLKSRSEANQLGEELTGVKSLVSSLRAQNHEHMNKMHSIAGLIQLDRTEEALELMIDETSQEETIVQFLRDNIKHYAISGLLLGKRARGKELGVNVTIDKESYLTEVVAGYMSGDIVSIVGNLLDNSMEASQHEKVREVNCLLQGSEEFLFIRIQDTGIGMSAEEQKRIFERGYSSKAKEGRGIGLALVKEIVEANHGTIKIHSEKRSGTEVVVEVRTS